MIDSKAKWETFSSNETKEAWELEHEAELLMTQEKMEKNRKMLATTMKTPGFKLFRKHIEDRVEVLRDKLEKGDDPEVRGQIRALRSELQFFDNWSQVEI